MMSKQENSAALIEIIDGAQCALADAVALLADARREKKPDPDVFNEWAAQVENIGTVAELATLTKLQSVCTALSEHLQTMGAFGSIAPTEEYGKQLVQWSADVLDYVQHAADEPFPTRLLEPLPEEARQQCAEAGTEPAGADLLAEQAPAPYWDEDPEQDHTADPAAASGRNDAEDDDAELGDALYELVANAAAELTGALQAEPVDVETSLSELDNMAMAAELANAPWLQQVCAALGSYLPSLAQDKERFAQRLPQLIEWAADVLSYIEQPDEPELAHKLLAPLPPELQSELQDPGPQTAFDDEDDDDVAVAAPLAFPEDDANEGEVGGILGILHDELEEVAGEMAQLLPQLGGAQDDPAADACGRYIRLVQRLQSAADALEMTGLRQVCGFIVDNLEDVEKLSAEQRQGMSAVLAAWPDQVLSYLAEPANPQTAAAVIDLLKQADWPAPLDEHAAPGLAAALAEPLAETDDTAHEAETRPTTATAEDTAFRMSEDTSPELINAFLHESPRHAADLAGLIGQIAADEGDVRAAQRLAHTLKGSANLVGSKGIANLTHHMEDILDYLHSHPQNLPPALTFTLQEAADCVETMMDALQDQGPAPDDAQRILQDVLDWANRIDSGQLDEATTPELPARPAAAQPEHTPKPAQETTARTKSPAPTGVEETLRVPTRLVDEMFRMVGEMSIAIGQTREFLKRLMRDSEELRIQDSTLHRHRIELEDMVDIRSLATMQRRRRKAATGSAVFDSLEMDQYDELYGSAHSFIESALDFREMTLRLQNELSGLDTLFLQQERLNKELQQAVMTTRMVPVNTIVSRLQRSVRHASRTTGKQAELIIEGGDLMLDGDVLSRLTDPLMHMLRNAVDHGLETTPERAAAGKPATGAVRLSFLQDGNNIVVHCADDGRGLDYERIRRSAVNKGLLDGQESPDHQRLARLILTPGFSTRDTATQVSGRGLGMDVVNTTIQELKGTMDIGDNDPAGCLITLRIPITLVTSHTVLVKAAGELSAVPTSSLAQILAPGAGHFDMLGKEITYQLGNDVYPAKSLSLLMGFDIPEAEAINDSKPVLLVRADGGIVAATVDQVVSSHNLVIKGMGRYVPTVRGVSGVAILGDGSVVAVLDFPDLLRLSGRNVAGSLARPKTKALSAVGTTPKVLIVDDSLSVRKSLTQLVEDAGYEALTANDGLQAVEILRSVKPAIVLADIEMPRMTGLELTSHIRAVAELRDLPVIVITSRSTKKHRDQAARAGVNAYVTKPFSEDELLGTIDSLSQRN